MEELNRHPQSWNWSNVYDAMERGDDSEVDRLLDNKPILEYRDSNYNTLLHIAARSGNTRLIRKYIDQGINVNTTNGLEETPLMTAAVTKRVEVVKLLIEFGASVNHTRFDGQTSLHFSIYSENPKIINLLIDCDNSIINVMDKQGYTALHVAASRKSYEIAHLLVNRGIDVDLGKDDNTPLSIAVKNNDIEMAKILLVAGATKVNYVFDSGATLLQVSVWLKNIEITRRILDKGIDINASNEYGFTALHSAIVACDYDQVALLIERGADLDAKTSHAVFNKKQLGPLHWAAISKEAHISQNIMKLLLSRHCDVNERSSDGSTPFHLVLKNGTVEDIELLTAFGANVHLLNYFGESVLHYAAMNDDPEVCRYLLNNYKFKVNEHCNQGFSPLHVAAKHGKFAVAKELIARGAHVDIKSLNDKTPLYYAATNRRIQVIKDLLEEGADINSGNDENDMLLKVAINRRSRYAASIIVMYLARHEARGMTINPYNLMIIEEKEYLAKHLEMCRVELRAMKEKKIYNQVSCFNILVGDKNVILGYARNKELLKNFEKSNYAVEFSIYKNILRSKMYRGVIRDEFERYVSSMLCAALPLSDPEHLIIKNIAKYVRESDHPNWRKYYGFQS